MPSAEILLAVVVPLAIWVLVLLFVLAILFAIQDGTRRLRRLHRVPCFGCRYYTGSSYLKCPVRPRDAASEAAIDCPDYETAAARPTPPPPKPRLKKIP